MSQPNLNFWFILRKENPESQQPNRNMHLEIGFCEHFCVQVTILFPGTTGKR